MFRLISLPPAPASSTVVDNQVRIGYAAATTRMVLLALTAHQALYPVQRVIERDREKQAQKAANKAQREVAKHSAAPQVPAVAQNHRPVEQHHRSNNQSRNRR